MIPQHVAVYREGATLTPAPPAHSAQPNTVIHQLTAGNSRNMKYKNLINKNISNQIAPINYNFCQLCQVYSVTSCTF